MKKIIKIRKMRYDDAKIFFLTALDHIFCKGYSEVDVLHGVGESILKNMVYQEIKNIPYATIKKKDYIFSFSAYNPGITSISIDPLPLELQQKYF